MSLEDELSKNLRDAFEGSPEMLESNFEGRDRLDTPEVLMILARGQRDLRDAVLRIAREIDNLAGP